MNEKNKYKINLNLIIAETILTSIGAGFAVPIINVFWNSIGMNQTDIGFVQMMFTIIIVFLDIPMGYVADKFNRKALNIIGDIGVSITFIFYAFSKNIYGPLIAECMLGIFMAMTNGVDQSFIKYNVDKIDSSGKLFKKVNTKVFTYRYIATLGVMIIGGLISKYSLRLAVGISFLPYMMGGFLAIFIKDYANKMESKHSNLLKDMLLNIRDILSNKKTRVYALAYMLGKEVTHPHIWLFTPLMIMVGVPIEIVSIGWIFIELFKIIGSKIAEKIVKLNTSIKFIMSIGIVFLWMTVIIINVNIYTVWIFALNGLVCGMVSGSLITPLQESVVEEKQATVVSIASTGARLLYIPLVYIINYLGNIKLQYALIGMVLIFCPISIYTYFQLVRCEKSEN